MRKNDKEKETLKKKGIMKERKKERKKDRNKERKKDIRLTVYDLQRGMDSVKTYHESSSALVIMHYGYLNVWSQLKKISHTEIKNSNIHNCVLT